MNAFAELAQSMAAAALLAALIAAGCVIARDSATHYGRRCAWASWTEIMAAIALVLWIAMVAFGIAWTYTK